MNFSRIVINTYKESADLTLARVCRYLVVFMLVAVLLNLTGVFKIRGHFFYPLALIAILIYFIPTLVYDVFKIHTLWSKYLVMFLLVLSSGMLYVILSYHVIIMLVFPLLVSCLYNERKSVIFTMLISLVMIIVSHFLALRFSVVPDEPLITFRGVICYGIIPRIVEFMACGIVCLLISSRINSLIKELATKNDELYEYQQTLIESLSELVEAQSQETGQHIKRVSEYTAILCRGLGYTEEETWKVSIASMMHDIGKILIPTDIIEKKGKLTDEEFEKIKHHVVHGKKILDKASGEMMRISRDIAYEHHEKWDGTGYMQYKGNEINKYARCVAVADVFDALVSRRPYKQPWKPIDAYNEIVSNSGKHFDPEVVEVFRDNFTEILKIKEKYPET